jgi:hypothetical protein
MLSDIGSPGTSAWANSLLELNQTSVARDWRASAAWLHDREAILRAFEHCRADLSELRARVRLRRRVTRSVAAGV